MCLYLYTNNTYILLPTFKKGGKIKLNTNFYIKCIAQI